MPNVRHIAEYERMRDVLLPIEFTNAEMVVSTHVFCGRELDIEFGWPLVEWEDHIKIEGCEWTPIEDGIRLQVPSPTPFVLRLDAGEFFGKWIHHSQRLEHQYVLYPRD